MTAMKPNPRLAILTAALCAAALFGVSGARAQTSSCCVLPDSGAGTVDMPPPCPDGYEGDLHIVDGLPAGSTIELAAHLSDFVGAEVPGGGLGGTTADFTALLHLAVSGTGALLGFNRTLAVPVSGTMDFAPRTPGDAVQNFDGELVALEGELFGDPDFCQLHVTSGTDFGMPSPGHTTLTRLGPPGSDFQVDSFFDITYRIDFQGCPGSILDGMGGTTQDEAHITTCTDPVPAEARAWGEIKAMYDE